MQATIRRAIIALALIAAAPASGKVPALLEVPENAVDPDFRELRAARRDLLIRLSRLKQQSQTFNAACASVTKGTAAAARCRQRHGELEALRRRYVADADAFNARVRAVPLLTAEHRCPSGREIRFRLGPNRRPYCDCPFAHDRNAGRCVPLPPSAMIKTAIPFEVGAVKGDVTIAIAGATGEAKLRNWRQGSALRANMIRTGPNSRFQILLPDETMFTVGPESEVILDSTIYDERTGKGEVRAKVEKGLFRFVTGKVARNHPMELKVTTGIGDLGRRGTDFVVEIPARGGADIWLIEGAIEFLPKSDGPAIVLAPGERMVVGPEGKVLTRTNEGITALQRRWSERLQ